MSLAVHTTSPTAYPTLLTWRWADCRTCGGFGEVPPAWGTPPWEDNPTPCRKCHGTGEARPRRMEVIRTGIPRPDNPWGWVARLATVTDVEQWLEVAA